MRSKLTTLFLLLALLFLPTGAVHAQSPDGGDVFLLGQNYTLKSDETLDGSLVVIGGNVDIEKDATVNGDSVLIGGNLQVNGDANGSVVLIGGNLVISGKIKGDIVLIGGQALLTETAVVDGDIVTMGGQVQKDPGAEVTGQIVNNAPPIDVPDIPDVPNVPDAPDAPDAPDIPDVPGVPQINVDFNPLWEVTGVFTRALAIAAVGMLLTLFLQPQLDRVADAITRQPMMAGSFGLLTVVVAPVAILIMIVTILLIPVAAIVAFILLPMAWLFGMVAIGQEIGDRFTKAINQTWAPVLSTGFGTFLFLLVGGFIGLIPCIGWLISLMFSLVALGGVMMTWFGTRAAPGSAPAVVTETIPPAS
ncbi:MAG TPA: polymer-forming cytoskeletal protein [Anaerolineales bacterium]|nr:polymer-forming cytoskeletal protein [Anaerolineales bacterium]HNC90039.1 polymer-forming cytoskeletal protein [Anaerolineales bacterium]HNH04212.1 polymer-forming cytoskeletal protein [Anaerolineales bacterium]